MGPDWTLIAHRLDVRPLSARSLVLTTLLGSHPPRLPSQAFVAVADLFGIPSGTVRTALSRMAADGELVAVDGRYQLGQGFVTRQWSLDAGRRVRREPWDGTWWTAIVLPDRRSLADRRTFRAEMARSLMGELRPDVWLRPANLAAPVRAGQPNAPDLFIARGSVETATSRDLGAALWDLDRLARNLRQLITEADRARRLLGRDDPSVLAGSFIVSVAVARALASEPQLPEELVGDDWPADELRRCYDELEALHRRVLHNYLTRSIG